MAAQDGAAAAGRKELWVELRAYWTIFRRRWWIAALLTLATAFGAWLLSPQVQGRHTATMRVLVSVPPEPKTGNYFGFDTYYSWLASEYLVDDFSEVVKSQRFADDIRAQLGQDGVEGATIEGLAGAQKTHRVLTLKISGSSAEQVRRVAEAAQRVIETNAGSYFAQLAVNNARVSVIDPPVVGIEGGRNRNLLDIAIRTAVGAALGLGLVFLLHYLDTRLYETPEFEHVLRLPVLGEIPAEQ
jgi:capsular polysaccharide biosynthesis protein